MNYRHLRPLEKKLLQYHEEKVDPVTKIFWDLNNDVIMNIAATASTKTDSILDVGCGEGRHLVALSRWGRDCFGTDPLHYFLLEAKKSAVERDADVFLCQGVGEFLSFRSEVFDVALCLSTLQHVSDQFAVLHEIKRVLRNGGLLIASVPTSKNLHSLFRETRLPDYFTRGFDIKGFKEMLTESGFRILAMKGSGFFPPTVRRFLVISYHLFGKELTREMVRALDVFANLWISAAGSVIALCQKEER